ncbi:MAG TPA: hypothetical protein VGP90_00100, partial [Acidimicrobiia bacterium]|nr:hypothetical protein [Acidimicrobiia bacterium]
MASRWWTQAAWVAEQAFGGDPVEDVPPLSVLIDGDGEPDVVAAARLDDLARPVRRVGAQHKRAGGAGPADPPHDLVDEPFGPPSGVRRTLAHPDVEHLAGVGPG